MTEPVELEKYKAISVGLLRSVGLEGVEMSELQRRFCILRLTWESKSRECPARPDELREGVQQLRRLEKRCLTGWEPELCVLHISPPETPTSIRSHKGDVALKSVCSGDITEVEVPIADGKTAFGSLARIKASEASKVASEVKSGATHLVALTRSQDLGSLDQPLAEAVREYHHQQYPDPGPPRFLVGSALLGRLSMWSYWLVDWGDRYREVVFIVARDQTSRLGSPWARAVQGK